MKRMTILVVVLAMLLSGCSEMIANDGQEATLSSSGSVAEEKDAFAEDVDSDEEVKGTKIPLESLVPKDKQEIEIQESEKEGQEPQQESSTEAEPVSPTVYRTRTGEKYHREGCYHLKSKFETTVAEAKASGLKPCSRCNPPQ